MHKRNNDWRNYYKTIFWWGLYPIGCKRCVIRMWRNRFLNEKSKTGRKLSKRCLNSKDIIKLTLVQRAQTFVTAYKKSFYEAPLALRKLYFRWVVTTEKQFRQRRLVKSQRQQHVRTRIAMVLSNPCFNYKLAVFGRLGFSICFSSFLETRNRIRIMQTVKSLFS